MSDIEEVIGLVYKVYAFIAIMTGVVLFSIGFASGWLWGVL